MRVTQLVESIASSAHLIKNVLVHLYESHCMTKIYGMNPGNRGEASKLTCKLCQKLCTVLLLYSSKTSFMYLHQQLFKHTKFIWYQLQQKKLQSEQKDVLNPEMLMTKIINYYSWCNKICNSKLKFIKIQEFRIE
jgi:hypothetical protein